LKRIDEKEFKCQEYSQTRIKRDDEAEKINLEEV